MFAYLYIYIYTHVYRYAIKVQKIHQCMMGSYRTHVINRRGQRALVSRTADDGGSSVEVRVTSDESQKTTRLKQDLLFWLFKGGFKVSSGTVEWYRKSYGTDFNSEIARPVKGQFLVRACAEKRNLVWGIYFIFDGAVTQHISL